MVIEGGVGGMVDVLIGVFGIGGVEVADFGGRGSGVWMGFGRVHRNDMIRGM